MTSFRGVLTMLVALVIFTACQQDSVEEPVVVDEVPADVILGLTAEEAETLGLTPEEARQYDYTQADIQELAELDQSNARWFRNIVIQSSPLVELTNGGLGLGDTVGIAKIIRFPSGVLSLVFSTGQTVGDATTIWVGAYNNPELCADEFCSVGEAFNPATNSDVLTGTGRIVRGPLTVYTTFSRKDDGTGSLAPFLLGLPAQGVTNPMTAQFRYIVKTHGQFLPEFGDNQLTTFQGGCEFGFLPPFPELGTPGPNTCAEIQISFFTTP